jgi:hypothetical protein
MTALSTVLASRYQFLAELDELTGLGTPGAVLVALAVEQLGLPRRDLTERVAALSDGDITEDERDRAFTALCQAIKDHNLGAAQDALGRLRGDVR